MNPNQILRFIHDRVVANGEYRARRPNESWFQWWLAFQYDTTGEDSSELEWTR